MDSETDWKSPSRPEPGSWLDDSNLCVTEFSAQEFDQTGISEPGPQAQSKLLELLGLINLKILSGQSLYLEVGGRAYKVLFSIYWRSVFTGREHYLLRCQEVAEKMWMAGSEAPSNVDLAIRYTPAGWNVMDCSLKLMVYRD